MVRLNSEECEPRVSEIHQGKGLLWLVQKLRRLAWGGAKVKHRHTHVLLHGEQPKYPTRGFSYYSPSIQCNTRRHLKYYILEGHLRA